MVDNATLASSILSSTPVHILFLLYTDPGTGALLWQLLLASLIGGAFYARQLMRQIKGRIAGPRRNDAVHDEPLTDDHRSQAVK